MNLQQENWFGVVFPGGFGARKCDEEQQSSTVCDGLSGMLGAWVQTPQLALATLSSFKFVCSRQT